MYAGEGGWILVLALVALALLFVVVVEGPQMLDSPSNLSSTALPFLFFDCFYGLVFSATKVVLGSVDLLIN